MSEPEKTRGKQNPASRPSEEEMAVLSLLFTARPTREESRLAVRHLLREASRTLERREAE